MQKIKVTPISHIQELTFEQFILKMNTSLINADTYTSTQFEKYRELDHALSS